MGDYKLSYTAEEVDELLGKVKGGSFIPVLELSEEIFYAAVAGGGRTILPLDEYRVVMAAANAVSPLVLKIAVGDMAGACFLSFIQNPSIGCQWQYIGKFGDPDIIIEHNDDDVIIDVSSVLTGMSV